MKDNTNIDSRKLYIFSVLVFKANYNAIEKIPPKKLHIFLNACKFGKRDTDNLLNIYYYV